MLGDYTKTAFRASVALSISSRHTLTVTAHAAVRGDAHRVAGEHTTPLPSVEFPTHTSTGSLLRQADGDVTLFPRRLRKHDFHIR